jgi:hypothetical protein
MDDAGLALSALPARKVIVGQVTEKDLARKRKKETHEGPQRKKRRLLVSFSFCTRCE